MAQFNKFDIYKNTAAGEFAAELIETANKMATPGKGLLAADESSGTIKKRFDGIGVESTEESRRFYRELLVTTEGLNEYVSGVILFEETLYQATLDGKRFVDILNEAGIVPGIKVDKGLRNIPGTDELCTQGIDNLGERCAKYYADGARFAKWRAVYRIDLENDKPSKLASEAQSRNLARYAAICQANGLVPIVEPEVLMDGDHSIETCAEVSEKVYAEVMRYLHDANVLFEGMILKPNMILPGAESGDDVSPEQIGWFTVRTLRRTLPAACPGVTFLSGGQSEEEASRNLNAVNQVDAALRPWNLSFSFGRALQATVLKTWAGKPENRDAAQEALLVRARANSEAQRGVYAGSDEESKRLYQKNYTY